LITELRAAGIDFALADVRLPVVEMARRMGVLEVLGEGRLFATVDLAIEALTRRPEFIPRG
jgi:hypothetical protein